MEAKVSFEKLLDLSGKTAIVTGGAMGIGLGIVWRLAEAGANVIVADLKEEDHILPSHLSEALTYRHSLEK